MGGLRYDGTELDSQVHTSRYSVVHSQYDVTTLNNDIALVQLPFGVAFTSEYYHIAINNIAYH
jgi:hypothetical protein